MPNKADFIARARARLLDLRVRYWTWRGARIEAREKRRLRREHDLRVKRCLTSPIAATSLTGGLIKPRKKWSLGR